MKNSKKFQVFGFRGWVLLSLVVAGLTGLSTLGPVNPGGAFAKETERQKPQSKIYTSSIGMKLVRIEPGRFTMGFEGKTLKKEITTRKEHFPTGDFDEHPAHQVEIKQGQPFACQE